jgi:hypothetical protein
VSYVWTLASFGKRVFDSVVAEVAKTFGIAATAKLLASCLHQLSRNLMRFWH